MAIVVNANSNVTSTDTWALVTSGVIINTILASVNDVNKALTLGPNQLTAVDYIVDLTIQGQKAGIGWTYNASGNTFTAPPPPPIDWISTVVADFDSVASQLLQSLSDAGSGGGNLTPTQLQNAFNASLEDSQDSFSPNQMALMQSIYNYILSGG